MIGGNPEFGAQSWTSWSKYEVAFRDNKINERVLPNLTQEGLKEIGVGPVRHRRCVQLNAKK